MALDPPNNKRKRGRPANASKLEADASQEPSTPAKGLNGDGDDAGRPKKRGRPRRQLAETAEGGLAQGDDDGKEASETRTRRKRGRPSLSDNNVDAESAKELRRAGAEERPRRRKHDKDQRQEAAGEEPRPSVGRTRGRPKRDLPPSDEEAMATRKDARSRTKPLVNGGAGPRRERRKAGDGRESANEAEAETNVETDRRKHGRRRPEGNGDGDGDGDDAPPTPPPRPFTHIAPQVHRVRKSTIEARWSPLGASSLAATSSMLRLAHRPILQRLSNTQQRREHTSAALHLIASRITRRISRGLPFPPPTMTGSGGTRGGMRRRRRRSAAVTGHGSIKDGHDDGRAAELGFESVLDAKQALERQLDPALHAVELLTREKERLERELERDYDALRNLESSARAEAREHRGLLRKAHVLAPAPEALRRGFSASSSQALSSSHGLFDDLGEDEADVKALGMQLSSHVESIANNLGQTEGIVPQMARGRAALQEVLMRYLDREQYESVLLGRHS